MTNALTAIEQPQLPPQSCSFAERPFDPSALTFEMNPDNGLATARVLGDLSPVRFIELGRFFRAAFASGYANADIDFSATTDVPPFCVGLLNRLATITARKGGSLTIRGISSFTVMMMRAGGLTDSLHLESVETPDRPADSQRCLDPIQSV